MSSDPQIWLFPPPGAPSPPLAQTSSFGPVALNDSIILSWSPPSQQPTVQLWCSPFTADGYAALSVQVCNGVQSPFTYAFKSQVEGVGSEGSFCHMSFLGTQNGNSVVWAFRNEAADAPRTWRGRTETTTSSVGNIVESRTVSSTSTLASTPSSGISSSSITPSSSSTTTTSSPSIPSAQSSTSIFDSAQQSAAQTSPPTTTTSSSTSAITTPPTGNAASKSSGLSPGASAGIGIGAAAFAIAVLLLIWYFIRCCRQRKKRGGIAELQDNTPAMVWKPGPEYGADRAIYELGTERTPELEGRRLGAGLNSPKN